MEQRNQNRESIECLVREKDGTCVSGTGIGCAIGLSGGRCTRDGFKDRDDARECVSNS